MRREGAPFTTIYFAHVPPALGKANRGQRCLIPGFTLEWTDLRLLLRPVVQWGWIELIEGWRSWWRLSEEKTPVGAAANTPA